MAHADFVHLRTHSAYSLSEGALKTKELVKLCTANRMPAVAVTDTGNLFGALEFSLACQEAGVQPIVGCILGIRREDGHQRMGVKPAPDPIVLLVQSREGWGNLLKLISRAYLEGAPGEAPQVALSDLEGHADGLIALTGGPSGPIGRLLGEGQDDPAETTLKRLAEIFPGRLYIELMRHGLEIENRIESRLVDLAYALDLPLVATNDVFFADAAMFEAHDALLCIAEGAYVGQPNRRRLTPEHRFKSAEEMRALFADLPEAVDNTLVIARRCAFMPEIVKPILPAFPEAAGNEPEELRRQAAAGLEARLQGHVLAPEMDEPAREAAAKPYRERLEFELGVIIQMGFAGYFLIVAEFIKWAKAEGIPVGPGRGSGAGSVVAWALTITDLDPLRWGLLFERFLNPERVSMPDFDIDFCQDRRDEVIRHVQEKYGRDRVAQIITFGKLQARAVLRDVGRVLQLPFGQVDKLCKLVPNNPANPVTLQQAIDAEPVLQNARDTDEDVRRLIDIALKLEGLYRHASTHAAGVVIGDRPLDELVPLYRDPRSDMPVTQFNMKWVEQAGLVKFDFLGLKTLTVLEKAVELVAERGPRIDLSALPLDDAKTYAMIGRGETTGIFQLESSGMRDVVRKLKPDRFEDIIALVALYRPGPMDNIPRYIACKHGAEQPDYLYPTLEPILRETYGIPIYQEQVLQIAQVLAGFSLGRADLLRRAMGKKIKSEMEAQRKAFVDGAVANGVPGPKAEQIFEQVDKFAGYGFNKSHAAAYALVAYQTAWMKANHPVEFLAASMTFELGNTDKLNVFRQELDRMGIKLLPPDINRSRSEFAVEALGTGEGARAIRYALGAIRNVGASAMQALVKTRETGGAFASPADFARRVDGRMINKRQLENLIAAGAFDSLHPNRRQLYEGSEAILRLANAAAEDRASGQGGLFGAAGGEPEALRLPPVADWPSMDRLKMEFEAIGFYLSAHPLDAYAPSLKRLEVVRYGELRKWLSGRPTTRATLAGIVVGRQERTSARGNRFAFVQLSDTSGVYEATVFSEVLAVSREFLEPGQAVMITADVQLQDELPKLLCASVKPLDDAVAQAAAGLKIFVADPQTLPSLKSILDRQGRGRGKVSLVLDVGPAREVEVKIPGAWAINAAARAAIKAIPGVVDVHDV
ncbi:MAG TPA: DNA polymerase III subunit alpha, partial [Methylomirabilota bacterium]|nr:DNA polymerase III subunit alpha [Methylomirabilota bacterium]